MINELDKARIAETRERESAEAKAARKRIDAADIASAKAKRGFSQNQRRG